MIDIKIKFFQHFWMIVVIWSSINLFVVCFADDTDFEIQAKQEFYERPLAILNTTDNANSTLNATLPYQTMGIAQMGNITVNYDTLSTTLSNVIMNMDNEPAESFQQTTYLNVADSVKAARFHLPLSIMAVLLSVSWPYKT